MTAAWHPIAVHFVVAGLLLGVAARWIGLTGRAPWADRAAVALVAVGTIAAVAAVRSGTDARVAVEAVPGSAALVRAHAAWGERVRDGFLVVTALELAALVRPGRGVRLAAALLGLAGAAGVVEAGARGGELVYARAAGVGVRSGDPADVGWLLLAGLHHQAALDEHAGRSDAAAELRELAARRFPGEPGVLLEAAAARLHERRDPAGALALLREVPATGADADRDLAFRRGWLEAEALEALGDTATARARLVELARAFPESDRVRRRLAQSSPPAPGYGD